MRGKRQEEHSDGNERWLISYADFITLLFAFFTVMYASSQADVEKMAKFESSLKSAFGIYNSGGDGVLSQTFPAHQTEGSVVELPIQLFNNRFASKGEVRDSIWQIIHTSLSEDQIKKSGLELNDDLEGVRVSLSSQALFQPGSTSMNPEAFKALDAVGEILKKSEKYIRVEGHTDSSAFSNSAFPSNWELAAGRAATVVRYLIRRHKIEPSFLSAVSFADQRPLVSNTSEENRSRNRRIELLISLNHD